MVGRAQRLRGSRRIREVLRCGRRARGAHVVVYVISGVARKSRIGFALRRSVEVRNSVERNRLRRLIRAALHHQYPALAPGHDVMVVFHRPQWADVTVDSLSQELHTLCHTLKLHCPPAA